MKVWTLEIVKSSIFIRAVISTWKQLKCCLVKLHHEKVITISNSNIVRPHPSCSHCRRASRTFARAINLAGYSGHFCKNLRFDDRESKQTFGLWLLTSALRTTNDQNHVGLRK